MNVRSLLGVGIGRYRSGLNLFRLARTKGVAQTHTVNSKVTSHAAQSGNALAFAGSLTIAEDRWTPRFAASEGFNLAVSQANKQAESARKAST